MPEKSRRLSRSQRIIIGFLAVIAVGTLLLSLPFATREGQTTTPLGALFTAVSSTCVTGLAVYDTYAHWTLFGQLVLLTLIQIGGLGFITISTFIMIMLRKKIGLSRRALIQESLSTFEIKGSVLLVRRIVLGTLLFEGAGAVILAARFLRDMGAAKAIYYGVFHSVSAFCNAGFDIMGFGGEYSSFCAYWDDPAVVLTLTALILIGGLGFVVWEDIHLNGIRFRRYSFHTKVVLTMTAALVIGGTALFILLERNRLFADMSAKQKLLTGLFSAVTPRTAGFNTVDTAKLSGGSLLLTMGLMLVGGNPGSTAGGVKTTTLFAILLYIKAYLTRQKDCVAFKSRMDEDAVKKATVVMFINLSLAVTGAMIIFACQPLPFSDVLFETFSAIGTVGMTTGVTRQLGALSRVVVMILMFCGRMGSLTFAMSFTESRSADGIRYPVEQITIG